jgi:cytochrome c biogenesis protein CcmG, thiol:disulfide interchange protein DsbE
MRLWQVALLGTLLAVFGLFGYGLTLNPRHIPSVLEGTPAAPFAGEELFSGEPVALEALRGKVVLVNFWASWCTECAREHKNLLRLHDRYRSHPEFAMVGIVHQDEAEQARDFLRRFGGGYPNIVDASGAIAIDYGVYGVPETFLIDRDGTIRCKHFGPIVGSNWDRIADGWVHSLVEQGELNSCG